MSTLGIVLIVVGAFILLGPIMLFFAKINKIDPFILDKSEEEIKKDERSYVLVRILSPLFRPLWLEADVINWVSKLFK